MTQEQFEAKILHMLAEGEGIKEVIHRACMSAISTDYGKSKYLDNADDDFILPKQVLTAVLEELAWQYEPITGELKKTIREIKPLIRIF